MAIEPDVESHLPLTETTFFILLSLAPGPKHGYAIMKDVQALSKTRVALSTGTLYGALKRLLDQGWIERLEDSDQFLQKHALLEPDPPGRQRKAYTLTDLGRRLLNAEVNRLRTLVAVARPRMAGRRV